MNLIKVTFPDGSEKEVSEGISLLELSKDCAGDYKSTIVAAKVDNDIKELSFHLYNSATVEFIDLTDDDGMRIYRRSLSFVLIKAVYDLFPERKVTISHSISKGIFCEVIGDTELTVEEVHKIDTRMKELIKMKIPFIKRIISIDEAKEIFSKMDRDDRFHSIEYRKKPYVTLYSCDGYEDYFYGYMTPDTGYLDKYALKYYAPGLILMFPEKTNPDIIPKFKEQKTLFSF